MDLNRILGLLHAGKERIDQVISFLERPQAVIPHVAEPRRRGRKSMNEEERSEVSARMKGVWAEGKKRIITTRSGAEPPT